MDFIRERQHELLIRLRQEMQTCLFSVCVCAAEVVLERYSHEEVNAEEGKTQKQ